MIIVLGILKIVWNKQNYTIRHWFISYFRFGGIWRQSGQNS